jgi:hypothetical protein
MAMNLGDDPFVNGRPGALRRAARPRDKPREQSMRRGGPGARLDWGSRLGGERIVNLKGETLGTLSDVLVDVARGCIAYAVMASGGFMGLGERFHPIPWRVLTRDPEEDSYVLDSDEARLAAAPVLDREHWANRPDAQWHERVHRYYGATPYWA